MRHSMSDTWAFLTIVAFPVAMLLSSNFGATPIVSFLCGMGGSVAMLIANVIVDRKLWMFEPKWRARFEQPDFAFRLALISGAILLILETALVVMFFTDGRLDHSLVNLVFSRQCHPPQEGFEQFCASLVNFYNVSP